MKHLFSLLAILICISNHASAQIDNQNQPSCRIWYEYDAAGQRVTRYYECKDPNQQYHGIDAGIRATIFPNPTDGPVIVVVDPDVNELAASIFTIDGAYIAGNNCNNCSGLSLSIAGHPPGSYVLQISAVKEGYPDLNEGYTIIKRDEE